MKGYKSKIAAPGKVKIDQSLESPRGYLKGISEAMHHGHTKIACDLDPHDEERNKKRARKSRASNEPESNLG